jgi:arylformamidase
MIYDVTWPITPGMTRWPGTPGPSRELIYSIERGDPVDFSCWTLASHAGTHVDAPSHFLPNAATIEVLDLDPFLGPCWLADCTGIKSRSICETDLAAAVPSGTTRLILRTRNSEAGPQEPFREDYVALSPSGAEWLIDNNAKCVGIDALSIEEFDADDHQVHHRLLAAGVAIIEGLRLADPPPGAYDLVCLPLPLAESDGSPVRAILVSSG